VIVVIDLYFHGDRAGHGSDTSSCRRKKGCKMFVAYVSAPNISTTVASCSPRYQLGLHSHTYYYGLLMRVTCV
jgi:hypothetical protein